MSYDYLIWRRSPETKTAMLAQCYDAASSGVAHAAMAAFDVDSFLADIQAEFGDVNSDPDGPFLYTAEAADGIPWVTLNVNYSQVESITDRIVAIAVNHKLMVYDPQRSMVWGNRRY